MPNPDGVHVRPLQSITPLSIAYDIPIQLFGDASQLHASTVRELRHRSGTILVSWQHEDVQQMMGYFGFDIPPWPDGDYDTVYVINWDRRTFSTYRQGFRPS